VEPFSEEKAGGNRVKNRAKSRAQKQEISGILVRKEVEMSRVYIIIKGYFKDGKCGSCLNLEERRQKKVST